jgi:hypothetical protein
MRDAGVIEPVSRGLYRLASLSPLAHPDLVTVATRVPRGVLCLISGPPFSCSGRPDQASLHSCPPEQIADAYAYAARSRNLSD